MTTRDQIWTVLVPLVFTACVLPDKTIASLADGSTSGESDGESAGGSSVGDGTTTTTTGDPTECIEGQAHACHEDPEGDQVAAVCDNAPGVFNPSQSDIDGDGVGDVVDLCPTVPDAPSTADADGDGIGDACDACPDLPSVAAGVPSYMQVRNIPDVADADGDGIGDACDNCVLVANCGAFDADAPWQVGTAIDRGASDCQADADGDSIGDACEDMWLPDAAGRVGFDNANDFDQDGLPNVADMCPRFPLAARIPCADDDACPTGSTCALPEGLCNHPDTDGDGVGDACDDCSSAADPQQTLSPYETDGDGDFIGDACEAIACLDVANPRPMAFFDRVASGQCCTTQLVEVDGGVARRDLDPPLRTADGIPLRVSCSQADRAAGICVPLPAAVLAMPGVLTLPPGCDGVAGGELPSSGAPPDWSLRCELPPRDQDFDGIADACDLCPYAFDPDNLPYIDDDGVVWQDRGKYCNGAYDIDNLCGE